MNDGEWVIVLLDSYDQLPNEVVGCFTSRELACQYVDDHYDGFDWLICPVKSPTD